MADLGVKDRLMLIINELGIEKAVFERNTGLSNGFIDKVTDNVRSSSLDSIVRAYPKFNRQWIKYGEGDRYTDVSKEKTEYQIIDTEEKYRKALETGLKMLPEVDFTFSAGQKALTSGTNSLTRYWYLPDCEDCEAVAPMAGTSMMPTYPPGCELILKRYGYDISKPNTIAFGNTYGIIVEDPYTGQWHGHIKVLRRHRDPVMAQKYWIAHSLNEREFDDFDIELIYVRGLWVVKQHVVTNILL